MDRALLMQQEPATCENFGQKETPIWNFIPIKCILAPLLHALLGIGNDLVNNYFTWVDSRIEQLTPDEIEARNMSLLAAIAVDSSKRDFAAADEELKVVVAERVNINALLKRRRLLSPEEEKKPGET